MTLGKDVEDSIRQDLLSGKTVKQICMERNVSKTKVYSLRKKLSNSPPKASAGQETTSTADAKPKNGAYERAREAAGIRDQSKAEGEPKQRETARIPTADEVIAYCQAATLGLGMLAAAPLGVSGEPEVLDALTFSQQDRAALRVPAEAAAPDIAALLGDVKYAGLCALCVALVGVTLPRIVNVAKFARRKRAEEKARAKAIRVTFSDAKQDLNGSMESARAGTDPDASAPVENVIKF